MPNALVPNPTPAFLTDTINTLQGAPQALQAPSLLSTLVNIAVSLAVVLALIYVFLWFLRKWSAQRGMGGGGTQVDRIIRVLDRHYLDGKRGLAVVDMGGKVLLLGLGENVAVLGEITDPKKAEELRNAAEAGGILQGFPQQLDKISSLLRKSQWQKNRETLKAQTGALKEQIGKLKPLEKDGGE